MSNRIERSGIHYFEDFILESKILQPEITKGEKYPSWDGEIIVYKKDNHNNPKNQIAGRVHVQVKSANRKSKIKESFCIKKADLENYKKEGGIIFIRPIYESKTSYAIWYKILLPVDIVALLNKCKRNSIAIKLKKLTNLTEFENACNFFLKQRPPQFDISKIIKDAGISSNNQKFVIAALTDKGDLMSIAFAESSYLYIEKDDGDLIPTLLKIAALKQERQVVIAIDDRIYFNKVTTAVTEKGENFIEINSALKIELGNSKVKITITSDRPVLLTDFIKAMYFLHDLKDKGYFIFDGKKISGNIDSDKILIHWDLQFFKNAVDVLNYFRIKPDSITIGEIEDNKNLFSQLSGVFHKIEFEVKEGQPGNSFFKIHTIFERSLLCLYLKNNNGYYVGYNYFFDNLDSPIQLEIIEKSLTIPCGRWFALHIKLPEISQVMETNIGYTEEIEIDLIKNYHEILYNEYVETILKFIKYYDKSKLIEFLKVAEKVNDSIHKENKDYGEHIYTINNLQIKKRVRSLSDDENKILINIKTENPENKYLICSILILLESFTEFKLTFDTLLQEEQNVFRNWPIWNLYPNEMEIESKL